MPVRRPKQETPEEELEEVKIPETPPKPKPKMMSVSGSEGAPMPRRKMEALEEPPSAVWLPEKVGEEVTGTVTKIDVSPYGGRRWWLNSEGIEFFLPNHYSLTRILEHNKVSIGETILIRFTGGSGKQKDPYRYEVYRIA
jgi:hypothetical protein